MLKDLRLALRGCLRSPLPTGVALLSIALSVGAAAVVFAAIQAVLLDPLPYAHPEKLVQIRSENPMEQLQPLGDWVVWNDAQELPRRTRTLESLGAYGNALFDLTADPGAAPEALYGLRVTANLFSVLGVSPMVGRNFLPEEGQPSHPDTMILSHGLWARRFHSDPRIVGRTVNMNGHACLVIGVMPPEFNFPMRRTAAHTPSPYVEFWAVPLVTPRDPNAALGAVSRLRPGVSLEQAREDLASIGNVLAREFPATNRDRTLTLNLVRDRIVGSAASGLVLLMSAALLFMLIGCTNVANLLLARGLFRRREIAVRLALGAGPGRIIRQLLTESCLLAVVGGLGGYLLTAAAWQVLPTIAPVSIPRLAAARADTSTLAFALVLAVMNGVLFGMAPALRLAAAGDAIGLGSRGAATERRHRLRSSLVTAEVAIGVILVVLGGQLLDSFLRLLRTDPGFQADHVLASVILPAQERYPTAQQRARFYQRILDSVRALPGVEKAGTADAVPFSGENHGGSIHSSQLPEMKTTAEIDVIGGDYLQAMGVRLLEGRLFRAEEMAEANDSVIIDTFAANQLWPGRSAIGQSLCLFCTRENPGTWKRVIAVVSNMRHRALNEPIQGNVYLAAGAMQQAAFLVVRATPGSRNLEKAIRDAVAALDPNQPVFLSASMSALVADSVADPRFIMSLLVGTACLALLMAAAGIYGVISYTTSRRTQEIGIRVAVGATSSDVQLLIFRQGFATVAVGLLIGIAAAAALLRLLQGSMAGLESQHGASWYIAIAVVLVTAGFACWFPARRAAVIDPVEALRRE